MTDEAVHFPDQLTKQIVELWCGGMSMTNIAIAIGRKTTERVKLVLDHWCDRERVYSKDGRSWAYRRLRRMHPEAPLTAIQVGEFWPRPSYEAWEDDDAEAAIGEVLDAADALNQALDFIEGHVSEDGLRAVHSADRRRVVVSVHDGRVHVAVDHRAPDEQADA